jgi:hypothetical protein
MMRRAVRGIDEIKNGALEIVSPRADRTTVMSLLSKIAFNSRYGGLISAKAPGRVVSPRFVHLEDSISV